MIAFISRCLRRGQWRPRTSQRASDGMAVKVRGVVWARPCARPCANEISNYSRGSHRGCGLEQEVWLPLPALVSPSLPPSLPPSPSAWQQHDVQELCRVMFDALEKRFRKDSHHAPDLINHLYQGTLKDYVKCLEVSGGSGG